MEHATAVSLIRAGVGAPGETWAELGAGSGVFTGALGELLGPRRTVYASDRDVRAVARLRALLTTGATVHVQRADFTRPCDLTHLTDLDGLLLANALHFVARQERVLRQLVQSLRPGGRLLVIEYDTRERTPWGPHPLGAVSAAAGTLAGARPGVGSERFWRGGQATLPI